MFCHHQYSLKVKDAGCLEEGKGCNSVNKNSGASMSPHQCVTHTPALTQVIIVQCSAGSYFIEVSVSS